MARINVDQKALTDPRFDLLARFLKASRHDALGRMIRVWNECQERESFTLPAALVGVIMGHRNGAKWVAESDLAEFVDENTLRIKGTEGRTDWLAAKRAAARANGSRGGRPTNRPKTNVGSSPDSPGFPAETPPAPAPAPAPAKKKRPSASSPGKPASKREPNPLFDAVAEITNSDPKATGGHVGKVAALLAKADPPYTPQDVREFARRFPDLCEWAGKDGRQTPTLGEVEKYIGYLRNPPQRGTPRLKGGFPTHDETVQREMGMI